MQLYVCTFDKRVDNIAMNCKVLKNEDPHILVFCTYRGEIEAKNKGMMKMYYVARRIVTMRIHPIKKTEAQILK
jgi:hypothetical protein